MEVKSGYKKADVGVIPEDWDEARIGDVTAIRVGRDLLEDQFSLFSDSTYKYPVYSNTVAGYGLYGFYSIPEYEGDSVTVVGRGVGLGTAFARTGGYGAIGRLLVLFPNDSSDASFLATYINERVNISIETGGIPQLTGVQFAKYKVALPPVLEQRAIAGALSEVDALLGGLGQLIAKKCDLKQASMQQLLTGQTRLPGFHGEWAVKRLGEIGHCFAGGTPSTTRSDYWGGNIIWLPSGRVQNNILKAPTDSEITITQRGLDESAAKKIKAHSVLVAITGATCANVAMLEFEAAANQSVVAIEPIANTVYSFLYYSLLMARGQILSLQNGSAQGGVNLKTVKSIELPCPLLPEQTAIAEVLSDMDAELAALEQRRAKTRALKQGMMQELLTGKIRLV